MNKKLLLTTLICTAFNFFSQAQVGVGTTTPNGALDVTSTTNGFVPPRVALSATNVAAPITNPNGGGNPVAGTVVYNTATAGTSPNNVAPGLYYWDGTRWVAFAGSPGGLDWSLTGNTGTTIASNFLGTSDNVDFAIRTNNTEKIRVRTDGNVGINNVGNAFGKLRVTNTGAGNDAIQAVNNDDATGKANAVWATNTNATGIAVIASSGATPPSTLPTIGAGIAGSHVDGHGVYAYTGNGTPNNTAHNGHSAGSFTLDTDNNIATNESSAFAKIAGKDEQAIGAISGTVRRILYGGYFVGGTATGGQSYSYVGLNYNHNNNATATGGTMYKVVGNGTVSTLIPDENNEPRVMFCPEAPEVLFEDYGVGQLKNGQAYIKLDEIVTKSMRIDEKHPLKVFIQLEDECNGVIVTNKTAEGFNVKELGNGNSNAKFSWHIVGNRADSKDINGNITSKYEDLRLPYGPKPLEQTAITSKPMVKN